MQMLNKLDSIFSRQSRFSDDARSSFSKNPISNTLAKRKPAAKSKDNQSGEEPSFGSPQTELPSSYITVIIV